MGGLIVGLFVQQRILEEQQRLAAKLAHNQQLLIQVCTRPLYNLDLPMLELALKSFLLDSEVVAISLNDSSGMLPPLHFSVEGPPLSASLLFDHETRIEFKNEWLGTIKVTYSRHEIQNHIRQSVYQMVVLGGLLLLTTFAVLMWLLRRIATPISKLSDVTKEIAKGNLEKEIAYHGKDEIGRLAKNISIMQQSIKEKIESLIEENTIRLLAEAELRKSEAFRHRIFDSSHVPVVVMDPGTYKFVDCNPAAVSIYGFETRENTLGKSPLDVSADYQFDGTPSAQKAQYFIEHCLSEGVIVFEWKHQRPDGTQWDAEVHLLSFESDQHTLMQFSLIDITERKRAEEALRRALRKNEALMAAIPDMMFLFDDQCHILDVHPRNIPAPFFISPEAFMGKRIDDVVPANIARQTHEKVESVIHTQALEKLTYSLEKDEEIRWYEARFVGCKASQVLAIVRDITELKRADDEREILQKQLFQSQKLETIGKLAGGIAHDFNNMLGVILSRAEVGMLEALGDEKAQQQFEEILKAGQRSADLVRQLLGFAREQPNKPHLIEIDQAIEQMLSMLQTIVGENIELAWQPGAPEIIVKMDPSQLDQVIINLCVNARDAIAGSGKIIIKTQSRMISRNEKNAPVGLGPGRYLLLIIQDNGCGMDEVVLTHLFEPFFTTKAVGKGTGLGLATLYGIIHQNRGAISVSSEVGSGSTFEIYMPVSDEGSTQKRAEPLAKKPAVLAQGTILLVEDEPMLQTITTTILEKQGYVVLTTSSAKEALSRAADYSDSIDLMITDIVMPDMNGRELAKQITHNLPGIKVLYMSGYASNMVTPADTAEREFHFIQKPFSVAQLTEKVADILGAK